jgi:hypothetical protein
VRSVLAAAALLALVVLVPTQAGAAPAQSFASCEQARAAGYSNMAAGTAGYSTALDRDGDGIACDESQFTAPPPEVMAATELPAAPAPVQAPAAPANALAETGVTSWLLLLVAAGLFLAGRRLVSSGYEHLAWVSGRRHSHVRYTVERRPRRRRR